MPRLLYRGGPLSTSFRIHFRRASFEAWTNVLTFYSSVIFNDIDKAAKLFPVPVMQCLQVKPMGASATGGERYRLVMSDGDHYVQAMLATQANHVIHEGKLVRGSFARVKQYNPQNLKGKK